MRRAAAAIAVSLLTVPLWSAEVPVTTFPPRVDSSDWTRLLEKYADASGLIAYASWKGNREDRERLDRYLERFAAGGGSPSVANLVNAYNAFIIRTVLQHYPVDGIRAISGAFTSKAHQFGGRLCSLDEIEHAAVRLGGFRVHATIVCASRSCPPLDRRAYEDESLPAREDDRMRAWMARPDLYRFEPDRKVAKLPKYFDWYRQDFEREGIPRVLSAYAPERYRSWLAAGKYKIEYLEYDWSLNSRGDP